MANSYGNHARIQRDGLEERRLIEVGELYGYEQSELRTFVQDKLAELKDERAERSRIERDERAAERAHALLGLEMKAEE